MSIYGKFFEILFPERCVGCSLRGSLLCASCKKRIPPAPQPEDTFITSIYAYSDFRIKKLIWLLKYKNNARVAQIFSKGMAQAVTELLGEEKFFLGTEPLFFVPIPLSSKRLKKRGYNQSEILAKEILKCLPEGTGRLETKLLQKHIDTIPQADIKKRTERLKNLGDCFSAHSRENAGLETIILIDDVTTTGATLKAARKALRAAGFRRIYALTIAH